jgi:molybdate transport system regulatory protein
MPHAKFQLQPRLRFPNGAGNAFGPGKAELLRLIGSTGSIRAAADAMAMSYNRAWMLVRDLNQMFREPLVSSVRGGKTGGGAELTPNGREVLARYSRMEQLCRVATQGEWKALRQLLK